MTKIVMLLGKVPARYPSQDVQTGVWAEMARRKVQFHAKEKWDSIKLWGLMSWGDARPFLERGELITDMRKENKTIWVRPSKEAWETKIKPLIDDHGLDELTKLAGWRFP